MSMPARSFDRADLLRVCRGDWGQVCAPRLPLPPLLGFDEVSGVASAGGAHGRGCAYARKSIESLNWIFDCHFVDDPVMPGSLLVEALLQLAGLYGALLGYAGLGRAVKIGAVRFTAEVRPSDQFIEYRLDVRNTRDADQLVIADGTALIRGEPCMTASRLCVAIIRPQASGIAGLAEEAAARPCLLSNAPAATL